MVSVNLGQVDLGSQWTRSERRESGAGPDVSIIIPAYNTAQYIVETLESVFAQTFDKYEVILINNGSSDTEELERRLRPYMDRIIYIKQGHCGVGAARNAGIRAARAPLIALLDSDDIWEPNYLSVHVGILQNDPMIDAVYPDAVYFGDCGEAGRRFMELCPSEGEVTFESLVTQRCNVMNSATMRRSAVLRTGPYDESLRHAGDFDFWLRMALAGGRIAYHRQVLVRYRRRKESLISNRVEHLRHILRIVDKTAQNPALTRRYAEILRRERRRYHASLRYFEGKHSFVSGDVSSAAEALAEANRFYRSWRLGMGIYLMRLMPALVERAYHMRRRVFLRNIREF